MIRVEDISSVEVPCLDIRNAMLDIQYSSFLFVGTLLIPHPTRQPA